jgi:DUF1009 family protein
MTGIAIIAGQGALPGVLAAALDSAKTRYLLAEMEGFSASVPGHDPIRFRIERLAPFLDHLADAGVTRVCFAGAVRRPRLDPAAFDAKTATLVPRLLAALQAGDDAALRIVIEIFEEWGFEVVGADQIAPALLPRTGVLTRISPDAGHEADARLGEAAIAEMGRADLGQACIVVANQIVAREDDAGTDALLRARIPPPKGAPRDGFGGAAGAPDPASAGIFFKAPKPDQDLRVDLPVIGPQSAILAAKARLSGIVIEAGGVMVLDLPRVVQILDAAGLFLWVRPRGGRG